MEWPGQYTNEVVLSPELAGVHCHTWLMCFQSPFILPGHFLKWEQGFSLYCSLTIFLYSATSRWLGMFASSSCLNMAWEKRGRYVVLLCECESPWSVFLSSPFFLPFSLDILIKINLLLVGASRFLGLNQWIEEVHTWQSSKGCFRNKAAVPVRCATKNEWTLG